MRVQSSTEGLIAWWSPRSSRPQLCKEFERPSQERFWITKLPNQDSDPERSESQCMPRPKSHEPTSEESLVSESLPPK
jgi:hypothetical protein